MNLATDEPVSAPPLSGARSASRTRLVNFRVTDEEYERLRQAAVRSGHRSISDFARAALGALSTNGNANGLETRVVHLEHRLDELAGNLAQLIPTLAGLLARQTKNL